MTIKTRKKRSILWKLPRDDMVDLVASRLSFAEILRYFGLHEGAGNYKTLKRRLEEESIPYEHLKGRKGGVPKGKGHNVRPLEEYLVPGSNVQGGKLKRRLVQEGLIIERCAICDLGPTWKGYPLVLALDHINGDSRDHRIENLRLLCPNCHSQTPTFSGKRLKKHSNCKVCAKAIGPKSTHCRQCASRGQPTKIQWPSTEMLLSHIEEIGFLKVALELGVSDNAVRKRLRKHGDPGGN